MRNTYPGWETEVLVNRVIAVASRQRDDWIDITREVRAAVKDSGHAEGVVTVFVPHTTAGITLQENADPPLKRDLNEAWERLFPWQGDYAHGEDNAAAHMKATLCGSSVQIPFAGGELSLGTWQAVYLIDFDGPRPRRAVVQVSG